MFKDYNMNQLVLPLDLAVRLQENDIAFSIHHLVESIPLFIIELSNSPVEFASGLPELARVNYL